MAADRTDSANTQAFLQQFLHLTEAPLEDIVIVADNQSSHKSQSTRAFLEEHGLNILFLPPYSSILNPVEHMWSAVKSLWKRMISKVKADYDFSNMERDI